jgi:polysaccharide biosynthesis/export protein
MNAISNRQRTQGMKKTMIGLIVAGLCLGLGSASPAPQAGREFVKEYKIGPKDLLEIKVLDVSEFNSQTVRVSEDGTIKLPLLGAIQVEGLTKDELEVRLAALLEATFIKNAQVSVFIKEYQSQRVLVIGAVEKPGMYELTGPMNLIQLISQTGGLKDNAAPELTIYRESGGGREASVQTIDLDDLLNRHNPKLNVPLQPNDAVYVAVDRMISVFVFGQVKNPGALETKASQKVTLLQAIAQAGGPMDNALRSGIIITRKDKVGKEIKIKANLNDIIRGRRPNIALQDGDVVYVPESFL